MKYTVQFREWNNNWSEMLQEERYDSLEDATERARKFTSWKCEYIGNNNYVNNGTETWVEDEQGMTVYRPSMYIDSLPS